MVVYICCAGGATSGLFCINIKKYCDGIGKKVYVDDIGTICSEILKGNLKEYELVLAYGPAEKVNKSFIRDLKLDKVIDCVIVSPQVRYMCKKIQELLDPFNIPCGGIDMTVFGRMNGKDGLKAIYELLEKNKQNINNINN